MLDLSPLRSRDTNDLGTDEGMNDSNIYCTLHDHYDKMLVIMFHDHDIMIGLSMIAFIDRPIDRLSMTIPEIQCQVPRMSPAVPSTDGDKP